MASLRRSARRSENPDKTVIAISGDGGMQMNIQEFATAVLEELPLILCVFNNEYLGHGAPVAEALLLVSVTV